MERSFIDFVRFSNVRVSGPQRNAHESGDICPQIVFQTYQTFKTFKFRVYGKRVINYSQQDSVKNVPKSLRSADA